MIVSIDRDTAFLADITATVLGRCDHRMIVEMDGSIALYVAAEDRFGMPYWEPVESIDDYDAIVASIVADLARAASDKAA